MVTEGPAEALHGRRVEREVLDRLLEAVRDGHSRVLVVSGEPGIGKTALLQSAIEAAPGFRVARAVGVESEMELAFAALQQLCAPMLHRLDRLPAPQQETLGVAFELRTGRVRGAPASATLAAGRARTGGLARRRRALARAGGRPARGDRGGELGAGAP